MTNRCRIISIFLVLLMLGGCGGPEGTAGMPAAAPAATTAAQEKTPAPTPVANPYVAPDISPAKFHRDQALGEGSALIDVSAVSEGYVAVSAQSESKLKFQVVFGDSTYTYDLPHDGTESIFSLQSGDGTYCFRIMENVMDTKYTELFSTEAQVTLLDEFQPFLRTNQYAAYQADSDCVKKAAELAKLSTTPVEVAQNIFSYICENVTYDKKKAETVQSGYIPVPDETMAEGKGICFDYASLAASMLRSQGIPTKIIFGYVAPGDLYHAWNMFYTEETGWITVEYQVKGGEWNRIDCTFAANGADPETIGDGTSYTDVYVY